MARPAIKARPKRSPISDEQDRAMMSRALPNAIDDEAQTAKKMNKLMKPPFRKPTPPPIKKTGAVDMGD